MFSKIKNSKKGTRFLSPEQRQIRREKRRRFWLKTGKVVLWMLAVGFVAHLSLNIYASVQLNRELAAIRQKGDPIKFSEVEPPAVPDAQNAALVYKQASASLRFSAYETNAMQTRSRDRTPQMKALMESALRNNQRALLLARQGAAMPQCRFPLDWKGDPMRFRFPYYAEIRKLARLLALDASAKARRGDREGALRDVHALFGMSHHLSREPFLIGYLVAQSVNDLGHRALGETLDSIPFSLAEARALEASLPQDDWTSAFRQSLVGERMMGIFAYESLGQTAPEPEDEEMVDYLPIWTRYPLLRISRPLLKMDEVQTLRMWRLLLDSPQSQQVPRPIGFGRTQDAAVNNTPSYAVLTKILFPVFGRASDNRDRAEVRKRQQEVALALNCFRTARGRYPATLQEAEGLWESPLPHDIYSQKPFVYKSDGKTFTLYSIGVNRVDDGGKDPYQQGLAVTYSSDDVAWSHSNSPMPEP